MTVAEQQNPLLEGLGLRRTPEPCALVIFGASGDLTRRKLFPALYALAYRRLLPERFGVVGVARTEATDDEFRAQMREAIERYARDELREDVWDSLAAGMRYVTTDFADEEGEDRVVEVLNELDETRGTGATACTTSPSRRARWRSSPRRSESGGGPTAGRASWSRSRSATISRRPGR